jgi:hypothetical protein
MRDGSLEWIAFGFGGEIALLGEAEPHGLDVGARCVLGGSGIAEGNGNDRNSLLPRFRSSRARYRRGAR